MTQNPGPPSETSSTAEQSTDPISTAVATGYAFEGPALELGGLMLGATRLSDVPIRIPLAMLNRHGLVAGATGTGKTKTLQLLAEQLSAAGVPVFVTQSPTDVPDEVLAQLGSRVQHQLRAHTPNDAKALKATVNTYPTSGYDDLGAVISSLGIGEAVVTVMDERGAPTRVAWTRLRARESLMGPSDPAAMQATVAASPRHAKYAEPVDRESAREKLAARPRRAPQGRRRRRGQREGQSDGERASYRPRRGGRTTAGSCRTSCSPAPSRTSCAPPPARSPGGCSRPGGADLAQSPGGA